MVYRLTILDMREAARKRGGRCLSPHYRYSPSKLRWQCAEGHVFERTGIYVRQGWWCPVCSGRDGTKVTLEDLQALAVSRGGACLSKKYEPWIAARWRCREGHEWSVNAWKVREGSWCPHCARTKRSLGISQMRRLAKARGGECLSKDYLGINAPLRWRCAVGHVWRVAPFGLVYAKSWCPVCAGKRPTLEDFQELARAHGGRCLSKRYRPNPHKLDWECKQGHRWSATPMAARQGRWCPKCAGRLVTLEDVQAKAAEWGGECLSPEYSGQLSLLRWRCAKGHCWSANWRSLQRGAWCPVCRRLPKHPSE